MGRQVEERRFVARDEAGAEVVTVAERAVEPGGRTLLDSGECRTADGRRVVPGAAFGAYTLEDGGARLTTTDPAEPRDWGLTAEGSCRG